MSKSNYLEAAIINHVLGSVDYTPATNVYVSLHTADPTDAASGAEVSGNDYARVEVANNQTNWPDGNPKSNGTAIDFPTPSGSWGTVTHWGIWDASTTGNLLYFGALTVSKAINNGDTVSFAIGDIDITED